MHTRRGAGNGKRLPRGPGPHPGLSHRGLTWAWCQPSLFRRLLVLVCFRQNLLHLRRLETPEPAVSPRGQKLLISRRCSLREPLQIPSLSGLPLAVIGPSPQPCSSRAIGQNHPQTTLHTPPAFSGRPSAGSATLGVRWSLCPHF